MAAAQTYAASGDAEIDGLLSGAKWTSTHLTFSFTDLAASLGPSYGYGEAGNGFKAFTSPQKTAATAVLANYAAVTSLEFTAVDGAAGDIRYGRTAAVPTAWAYEPHASAEGGDVWISNTGAVFSQTAKGGYTYLTLLHETGHAMGLKHTDEASGAFGVLPTAHDSLEYTVMSYNSYVGANPAAGYQTGTWDYPQTLMLDDITALQSIYGANWDHAGETVVYRWSEKTGELFINDVGQGKPGGDRVFMTIWTGGAQATYDVSNYAGGVELDLRPGAWSTISTAQLAHLDARGGDTHLAAGNITNAYLVEQNGLDNLVRDAIGGAGNDHIIGNAAANRLTGGGGNDILDGGAGVDTALYSGRVQDYAWTRTEGGWTVQDLRAGAPDGVDQLSHIEHLRFADSQIDLAPAADDGVRVLVSPADLGAWLV